MVSWLQNALFASEAASVVVVVTPGMTIVAFSVFSSSSASVSPGCEKLPPVEGTLTGLAEVGAALPGVGWAVGEVTFALGWAALLLGGT